MAQDSTPAVANKAAKGGDHDKVTMLSLRADGTPDQVNPEFIGDKDAAIAATTEQFKQQAVSAVDVEIRAKNADAEVSDKEDPSIAELQKAHEGAAKAAESDAKAAVDKLHKS
jgi:hypothetical protein